MIWPKQTAASLPCSWCCWWNSNRGHGGLSYETCLLNKKVRIFFLYINDLSRHRLLLPLGDVQLGQWPKCGSSIFYTQQSCCCCRRSFWLEHDLFTSYANIILSHGGTWLERKPGHLSSSGPFFNQILLLPYSPCNLYPHATRFHSTTMYIHTLESSPFY